MRDAIEKKVMRLEELVILRKWYERLDGRVRTNQANEATMH